MHEIVFALEGQALTSTAAIADGTGIQHKNVLELARTYADDLAEFGRVAFETQPFETAGGTQQREVALLNEQQATLLITYMRNGDTVRAFKKRLVSAFYKMAQELAVQRFKVPQSFPEAMRLAADLAEQKAQVEQRLAIAAPKADALDLLSASDEAVTFREAAKLLSVKREQLTNWLHANGWVYRLNGRWVGYQKHIENGHLQFKEARYTDDKTGQECRSPYCHILPKGMTKLATVFAMKEAA
jgi:phage antirepressor YoqD-like protein